MVDRNKEDLPGEKWDPYNDAGWFEPARPTHRPVFFVFFKL